MIRNLQLVILSTPLKNSPFMYFLMILLVISQSVFALDKPYPKQEVNGVLCYVYKVQPSEGFFRVSQNFGTNETELKQFNPQLTDGLKVGMEIFIPVKNPDGSYVGVQPKMEPQDNTTEYLLHEVERRQTIFRIRRLYDITEEELIEHNPQIKDRSIQVGEKLRIPIKKDPKTDKNSVQSVKSTDNQAQDSVKSGGLLSVFHKDNKKQSSDSVRIAFLLPLMLDQKPDPSDSRFVEFYAGALVAIQEAKMNGKKISVHTFDTEKSDLKLMEILRDSILTKVDIIIGPAYAAQVSLIGDFARMHRIRTIIPFSSRIFDLNTNPYIYQFNPGQEEELRKLQEILRTERELNNIIFAELPSSNPNDDAFLLTHQLKLFLNNNNIHFRTVTLDELYKDNLRPLLNPTKENIVFFNTSRINSLREYLVGTNSYTNSVRVKIYEPYSWRNSNLEKPRSFYLSVFKDEYPVALYENYLQQFTQLFNWQPAYESPRYDLLGYDLTQYYLKVLHNNSSMPETAYPPFEGIQSMLKFEKSSPRGGYINRQLNHYE